jgi:hypothetical protein
MAPYYDNPGQINDEALNIAGGRTYQVIQLADSEGNVIDPASGEFSGPIEFPDEFIIANTADTPVNATLVGKRDEGNSTTTNLAAGATFTGTGVEASPFYGTISVCIISSHDSAVNGLKFQASIDNVQWETIEQYNYVAANGLKSYSFSPSGRYFRLTYTNGGTTTTKLAIFTVLRSGAVKASSHRIKDNIDGEHDAELVKAVLAAERPDGSFTDINATQGGNLKISLEEVNGIDPIPVVSGLEIPPHDYVGMTYTGSNLTGVTYKTGGSGGTTVATLTLAYDGNDNLTSVTKS